MTNNQGQGNFWPTIPGVLTGLAALITAIAGVYFATQKMDDKGVIGEIVKQGDSNGNDIRHSGDNSLALNETDCKNECGKYPNCRGVVVSQKSNRCWLKDKVSCATPDKDDNSKILITSKKEYSQNCHTDN